MSTGNSTRRGVPRWLIILLAFLIVGVVVVGVWNLTQSGWFSWLIPERSASTPPPATTSVDQVVQQQLADQVTGLQKKYQDLQTENDDLVELIANCGDRGVVVSPSGFYDCGSDITAESTPEPQMVNIQPYTWDGFPDCPYKDTGSSQPLNKDGSIPITQVGDLWEADLSQNGCALLFEGRIIPGEELHRIIVLRSKLGENAEYVKDGKFTYAEGSIWGYDRTWNMEEFSTPKAPIAAEYVDDKAAVMKAENSYEPIKVYLTNGQVMEFAPGETWVGVLPNDACEFEDPLFIPVHGEILPGRNGFSAAIGAIGCTTVAWIDGNMQPEIWTGQRDGERKVQFASIEAWLMPSSWDSSQIQEWINYHK